jgi:Beta-lactamase inhibitor (BLIP)
MSEKKKKPFYKRWWVWVLAIIIVAAVASGGGESSDQAEKSEKKETTEKATTTAATPKEEPKKDEKKGVVTKEKFEQIKDGMTYEEVVKIIGAEGELLSETGEKGTQFHTAIYQFEGDGSFGANANFTFQGGKLVNKAQFGIKDEEASKVTITKEEFDKIQNGMTYEEVVKIVGGEGHKISETGKPGAADHTVMYDYQGEGEIGANASLMFQGGKLINKSQFGLK